MKINSTHDIVNFISPIMRCLRFLPSSFFSIAKSRTIFLVYHSVSKYRKNKESYYFTVSLKKFRSQMKFLHENEYQVLNLLEWYKAARCRKKTSDRTVVLTFDDGYADNFYYVCPVLKKYGFKATFFPIYNYIDSNKIFLWLNEPTFPLNANLPLKSGQIRQMDDEDMEIGSHTLSHKNLNKTSKQESWKEINESKDRLEDILGHRISSFSYPFGSWSDFNSSHQSMVKRAGYKLAVTNIYGSNSHRSDLTMLNRTPVYNNESSESFAMKCEGYYSWVGKLQWILSNFRQYI